MNLKKELYKYIDSLLYNKIGEAIYAFDDIKSNDDKVYVFNNSAIVHAKDNELNINYKFYIHILFVSNGDLLPIAYYNIEEDERAFIKKVKEYPEATEAGHYRKWRFVSEAFKNV